MPVEIKELYIRVTVNDPLSTTEDFSGLRGNQIDTSKLVKECVEQVLETLKQQDLR